MQTFPTFIFSRFRRLSQAIGHAHSPAPRCPPMKNARDKGKWKVSEKGWGFRHPRALRAHLPRSQGLHRLVFCAEAAEHASGRSAEAAGEPGGDSASRLRGQDGSVDFAERGRGDDLQSRRGLFGGRSTSTTCAEIARRLPHKLFSCYTKSLDLDLTPLTNQPNWIVIK